MSGQTVTDKVSVAAFREVTTKLSISLKDSVTVSPEADLPTRAYPTLSSARGCSTRSVTRLRRSTSEPSPEAVSEVIESVWYFAATAFAFSISCTFLGPAILQGVAG
jgi:hypothetical protein